ncbi:MAG: DUF3299 domain-containing protein [Gemmataceae bacterium]|nr:DUF3299 domain-containing protein [Gemmataceae bacterium]MDW8264780.1 DUF3299 domain-containing protein [Gemmataceae bacterium]
MRFGVWSLICLAVCASRLQAGLHYSGETFAELPAQWRGFLLDHRMLRMIGAKPTAGNPPSPARERYLRAAAELEKTARGRKLTADEQADLGAIWVRLGEVERAIELLRSAQREFSDHYRIVSNLGTAWQLQGDLHQAAACLQLAVRLAPGRWRPAEEAHLKLVRLRQRQPADFAGLDDLFGLRFIGPGGKYAPGQLAPDERSKLSPQIVAVAQQLALWLPADGKLLWLLAELANAYGDVAVAAAMLEGCTSEFALHLPEVRQHRQVLKAAADALLKPTADQLKTAHESHPGSTLTFRSKRPLISRLDSSELPPITADGINPLPWAVLAETLVDDAYRPTFARHLKELEGKTVSLSGFMQPLGDDLELSSFMLIEYPVGCWYCEVPEITGIVFVELAKGKVVTYNRNLVKVVGTLKLNNGDPENFLYTIAEARIGEVD